MLPVFARMLGALALSLCLLIGPARAEAPQGPLSVFADLVGKTWRGAGQAGESAERTDIIVWETIMGGLAVQSTHSIDDGHYGGRTIFFYSPAEAAIVFHYFTTGGFHSTGTIEPQANGDLLSIEHIHGLDDVQEVRAVIRMGGASWEVSSLYLRDGAWVEGDGFSYVEAPGAEVRFRVPEAATH